MRLNPSNKWHRRGMAAALVLLAFLALMIATAPGDAPPPVSVARTAPVVQPAPMPVTPQNSQLILELFNPSDEALTHELSRQALQQHIEQALTASFVLTKCGIIDRADYRDTFRALILYAQQSHLAADAAGAEAEVRRVAESSSASYALVYSRTRCSDPQLPALADTLHRWTQLQLTQ